MILFSDHRTGNGVGGSDPMPRRVVIALVLILAWIEPAIARPQVQDASGFVRVLGDEVVTVLQDQARNEVGRRDALRAIFLKSFDTEAIARFALGRYWRVATGAQKVRYLGMLPPYVADIYAGRLSSYAGEVFVVLHERRSDSSRTLVATEIRRPDGGRMKVDFRIHRTGEEFRAVDVVVEGVSLLITKRDEFATVIRRGGIDGLLALLEQRTQRLK